MRQQRNPLCFAWFPIGCAIVLLCSIGVPATAKDLEKQVADLAQPLIDTETVSGLAIGLIDAEGRHAFGFGRVKDDGDAVPDGDTLFVPADDGKVDELILHQNGRDMPGKRIEDSEP